MCLLPLLPGGIWLSCEQGFVGIQIARLDQSAIGWNEIAGRENDDVAGDDICRRNVGWPPVPECPCRERDLIPELFGRVFGPVLLNDVEYDRHRYDECDDHEARDVTGEGRYGGCTEQYQNERIAEASEKGGQQAFRRARVDPVRSDGVEFGGRRVGAQAFCGRTEGVQQLIERLTCRIRQALALVIAIPSEVNKRLGDGGAERRLLSDLCL